MESELLTQAEPLDEFQQVRHGFNVAKYALLIPEGLYSEVVSRPRICSIPTTPDWFSGFINHRGETVPVYDLANYASDAGTATKSNKQWVLLLDEHPFMVGILLDAPPQGLVSPELTDIQDVPKNDILHAFTRQYYTHQGKQWADFDHRQLFKTLKKQF